LTQKIGIVVQRDLIHVARVHLRQPRLVVSGLLRQDKQTDGRTGRRHTKALGSIL